MPRTGGDTRRGGEISVDNPAGLAEWSVNGLGTNRLMPNGNGGPGPLRGDGPEAKHRHVEVKGFDLHYVEAGHGHPMVLLHGDSASALDWKWVLPTLARQFRALALDFPGHGDSAKPAAPYSSDLFADTVTGFLEAVGIDEAVLVGHSLGGLVAARVALRAPDRVTSVCLVASGGLGRAVHPSLAAYTLPGVGEVATALGPTPLGRAQRSLARALLLFANSWQAPSEWLAEQARLMTRPGFAQASLRTRRSAMDAWGQKDLVIDDLPHVSRPTLVVWGAYDMVVPVSHAHAAMAVLPDARLEVLPDCGHLPQIECSRPFAEVLTTFATDTTMAARVRRSRRRSQGVESVRIA